MANDPINHPSHYTAHPSGIECITVTEHMTFNAGNAIKYLWRAGLKGSVPAVEDLKKARWYIDREIERVERAWHRAEQPTMQEIGAEVREAFRYASAEAEEMGRKLDEASARRARR